MKILNTSLMAAALAVSATNVQAQPADVGPWAFSINAGAVTQSEADLDAGEGAFSFNRWFAAVGLDYLWDTRTALGLSVGGGQSHYDFKSVMGFSDGEPWGDVEDQRVSLVGRFPITEQISGIVVPSLRYNREKGADRGDSQTWGLLAGISWRLSDSLVIGPGLGVFDRLEESTRVFPLLVIDWDINERWNLSTGRGLAASQGPGLTLGYKASDAWTVGLSGRYEQIDFRLDEEGPAPGGVGRDEVFPLVLSADWQPNPGMGFSVFAGAEFGGSLELADQMGNTVATTDYDTTLILGGTFNLRF